MTDATTRFETCETAWCPGCGNFSILNALARVLGGLGLRPDRVLLVGGIGQAAKTPQFVGAHAFCGLHGRALPPAVAAKLANPALTVVVTTGDGDSYGEGGNHFVHAIRRNADITHIVHDNQIYGLTKGQASPTTAAGHVTTAQPAGSPNEPLNPLRLALALGCGFVARAFTGDPEQLAAILVAAVRYRGYALVDVLQPCVSFNKVNTWEWYRERVRPLGADHDPTDPEAAYRRASEWGDRIPTGIFFNVEKPTFADRSPLLRDGGSLVGLAPEAGLAERLLEEYR